MHRIVRKQFIGEQHAAELVAVLKTTFSSKTDKQAINYVAIALQSSGGI